MSAERSQDLLNPPAHKPRGLRLPDDELELESRLNPTERRLGNAIRNRQRDPFALVGWLHGIAPAERPLARVLVVRELGADRGSRVLRQAFGEVDHVAVRAASATQRRPVEDTYALGRARTLADAIVRMCADRDQQAPADALALLAAAEPSLRPHVAVALRTRRLADGAAAANGEELLAKLTEGRSTDLLAGRPLPAHVGAPQPIGRREGTVSRWLDRRAPRAVPAVAARFEDTLDRAGRAAGRFAERMLATTAGTRVVGEVRAVADAMADDLTGAIPARRHRAVARDEVRSASPLADEDRRVLERGEGETLPYELERRLARLLGHDFSHVRIHTDAAAGSTADRLGARALTVGSHIFFRGGAFAPGTPEGDRLLVHELTHVVQHDHGRLSANGDFTVTSPSDAVESEARAAEAKATKLAAAPVVKTVAPAQKQVDPERAERAKAEPVKKVAEAKHTAPKAPVRGTVAAGSWLSSAWDVVAGTVEAGAELAEEALKKSIESVLPAEVDTFLFGPGGPVGYLENKFESLMRQGFEALIAPVRSVADFGRKILDLVHSFAVVFEIMSAGAGKQQECCKQFEESLTKITAFAKKLINNPVVAEIKKGIELVGGLINKVVGFLAFGVMEIFKTVIPALWAPVQTLIDSVTWVFEKVKAISSMAWNLFSKMLAKIGLSGSGGGVVDWIKQKLEALWTKIKATFNLDLLKQVGAALLDAATFPLRMLSEGWSEVVTLATSIGAAWKNRNNPAALAEMGKGGGFNAMMQRLFAKGAGLFAQGESRFAKIQAWIGSTFGKLEGFVASAAAWVRGNKWLSPLATLFDGIVGGGKQLLDWGTSALGTAVKSLQSMGDSISAFIAPYIPAIEAVASAILNPLSIPAIVASWYWMKLDNCIKVPLINSLLDVTMTFLQATPDFGGFGALWQLVRRGFIGFVGKVKATQDAGTKVKLFDGVARMFLTQDRAAAGFVVGAVEAVKDNIVFPFEAIWMGIKAIVWVAGLLDRIGLMSRGKSQHRRKMDSTVKDARNMSVEQAPDADKDWNKEKFSLAGFEHGEDGATRFMPDHEKPKEGGPAPANGEGDDDFSFLDGLGPKLLIIAKSLKGSLDKVIDKVKDGFVPVLKGVLEGSGGGITFDGLMSAVSGMWDKVLAKVEGIGESIADKLMTSFSSGGAETACYEIGKTIGYIVGTVLFQVLLDILTAGTYTFIGPTAMFIARFINWPAKLLGPMFEGISHFGGSLVKWIPGLSKAFGALGGGALKALDGIMKPLTEFAETIMKSADSLVDEWTERAGAEGAGAVSRSMSSLAQKTGVVTTVEGTSKVALAEAERAATLQRDFAKYLDANKMSAEDIELIERRAADRAATRTKPTVLELQQERNARTAREMLEKVDGARRAAASADLVAARRAGDATKIAEAEAAQKALESEIAGRARQAVTMRASSEAKPSGTPSHERAPTAGDTPPPLPDQPPPLPDTAPAKPPELPADRAPKAETKPVTPGEMRSPEGAPRAKPGDPVAAPKASEVAPVAEVSSGFPYVDKFTQDLAPSQRNFVRTLAKDDPAVERMLSMHGKAGAEFLAEIGEGPIHALISLDRDALYDLSSFIGIDGVTTLVKTSPQRMFALMHGAPLSGFNPASFAKKFGLDAAGMARSVFDEAPRAFVALNRQMGEAELARALSTDFERTFQRARDLEGRIWRDWKSPADGTVIETGAKPVVTPATSPEELEGLAKRAGVSPEVLSNPSSDPAALRKVIDQMRAEMTPAQREALDVELNGRRFVDAEHYDKAVDAGVVNPHELYGKADLAAWSNAERSIMASAREGEPLTVEMLERTHAQASENLLKHGGAGQLRAAEKDVARQGGRGEFGIQTVTDDQLAALRANRDLTVDVVGPAADGAGHDVMVAYTDPAQVRGRVEELVSWVNTELAKPGADVVGIAAEAQRQFISIHPFKDGNGRTSRLLMDYITERGGATSAILRDTSLDTVLSPEAWRKEVQAGLDTSYERTRDAWSRSRSGVSDAAATTAKDATPVRALEAPKPAPTPIEPKAELPIESPLAPPAAPAVAKPTSSPANVVNASDVAPGYAREAVPLEAGASDVAAIRAEHSELLGKLEAGQDVILQPGEASAELMAKLTRATDREVALLRMEHGTRVLRLGTHDSVSVVGASRVIAHTHPNGELVFSSADISELGARGQRSSVIIDSTGNVARPRVPDPAIAERRGSGLLRAPDPVPVGEVGVTPRPPAIPEDLSPAIGTFEATAKPGSCSVTCDSLQKHMFHDTGLRSDIYFGGGLHYHIRVDGKIVDPTVAQFFKVPKDFVPEVFVGTPSEMAAYLERMRQQYGFIDILSKIPDGATAYDLIWKTGKLTQDGRGLVWLGEKGEEDAAVIFDRTAVPRDPAPVEGPPGVMRQPDAPTPKGPTAVERAYAKPVDITAPSSLDNAAAAREAAPGVKVVERPGEAGIASAGDGQIYLQSGGIALASDEARLAELTTLESGELVTGQQRLDAIKAHETVHLAQQGSNDAAKAAFPGQARIGERMAVRTSLLPSEATIAREADAMVSHYIEELYAYRMTGTHGLSIDEQLWNSMRDELDVFCSKYPKAARELGLGQVTDTRSLREWSHKWLRTERDAKLALTGESRFAEAGGGATPIAHENKTGGLRGEGGAPSAKPFTTEKIWTDDGNLLDATMLEGAGAKEASQKIEGTSQAIQRVFQNKPEGKWFKARKALVEKDSGRFGNSVSNVKGMKLADLPRQGIAKQNVEALSEKIQALINFANSPEAKNATFLTLKKAMEASGMGASADWIPLLKYFKGATIAPNALDVILFDESGKIVDATMMLRSSGEASTESVEDTMLRHAEAGAATPAVVQAPLGPTALNARVSEVMGGVPVGNGAIEGTSLDETVSAFRSARNMSGLDAVMSGPYRQAQVTLQKLNELKSVAETISAELRGGTTVSSASRVSDFWATQGKRAAEILGSKTPFTEAELKNLAELYAKYEVNPNLWKAARFDENGRLLALGDAFIDKSEANALRESATAQRAAAARGLDSSFIDTRVGEALGNVPVGAKATSGRTVQQLIDARVPSTPAMNTAIKEAREQFLAVSEKINDVKALLASTDLKTATAEAKHAVAARVQELLGGTEMLSDAELQSLQEIFAHRDVNPKLWQTARFDDNGKLVGLGDLFTEKAEASRAAESVTRRQTHGTRGEAREPAEVAVPREAVPVSANDPSVPVSANAPSLFEAHGELSPAGSSAAEQALRVSPDAASLAITNQPAVRAALEEKGIAVLSADAGANDVVFVRAVSSGEGGELEALLRGDTVGVGSTVKSVHQAGNQSGYIVIGQVDPQSLALASVESGYSGGALGVKATATTGIDPRKISLIIDLESDAGEAIQDAMRTEAMLSRVELAARAQPGVPFDTLEGAVRIQERIADPQQIEAYRQLRAAITGHPNLSVEEAAAELRARVAKMSGADGNTAVAGGDRWMDGIIGRDPSIVGGGDWRALPTSAPDAATRAAQASNLTDLKLIENARTSVVSGNADWVQKEIKPDFFGADRRATPEYLQQIADDTVAIMDRLRALPDLADAIPETFSPKPGVIAQRRVGGLQLGELATKGKPGAAERAAAEIDRALTEAQNALGLPFNDGSLRRVTIDRERSNFRFDEDGKLVSWFDPIVPAAPPKIGEAVVPRPSVVETAAPIIDRRYAQETTEAADRIASPTMQLRFAAPADLPAVVERVRGDMRGVVARNPDGSATSFYDKLMADSVLGADQKERVIRAMARVTDHYEEVAIAQGTTGAAADAAKAYQEVNRLHTLSEIDRVLDASRRLHLSATETEDALLASIYSDSHKFAGRASLLTHNQDGADAAAVYLRRELGDSPEAIARIARIRAYVKEHQIGPPAFFSNMLDGELRAVRAAKLKAANPSYDVVKSGPPFSDAEEDGLRRIKAKIADPLNPANLNPTRDAIHFTPEEQALLDEVGIHEWPVPRDNASMAVIAGDSMINYASPEGVAKIVKIRGPGTFMPDKTAQQGVASVLEGTGSAPDARSILSETLRPMYDQQVEATRAAVARAETRIDEWLRAQGRDPANTPFWRDTFLDYGPEHSTADWDFAIRLRAQFEQYLRDEQSAYLAPTVERNAAGASVPAVGVAPAATPAMRTETEIEQDRFAAIARAEGIAPADAKPLFELAGGSRADAVTGFETAGARVPTVKRAIEFVAKHPEQRSFYIEADVRNLSGLNSVLGATGANRVFAKLTSTLEENLRAVGGSVQIFRHGGDEVSAVVTGNGVTSDHIDAAFEKTRREIDAWVHVQEIAEPIGGTGPLSLSAIPHPKHVGDATFNGTGLSLGQAEILGSVTNPTDIFRQADRMVEADKLAHGVGPTETPSVVPAKVMAPGTTLSPGTLTTRARSPLVAREPDLAAAPDRTPFLDDNGQREADFVKRVRTLNPNIKPEAAASLFEAGGGRRVDAVTGFDTGAGRVPTLKRAIVHVAENPEERAIYAEVDIRNLGGLNAVLGHSGANEVYRTLSETVQSELHAIGADVADFRHGGDEISFILTGRDLSPEMVEAALRRAQQRIASYVDGTMFRDASGAEHRLADIAHPKHLDDAGYAGTGVTYGIAEIVPPPGPLSDVSIAAQVPSVFSRADQAIEAMKKSGGTRELAVAPEAAALAAPPTSLASATDLIAQGRHLDGIDKIDLMGGPTSRLGEGFLNVDRAATSGLQADVAQVPLVIQPGSVSLVVVNNPQALFLDEVAQLLKPGGQVVIRGNFSNRFVRPFLDGGAAKYGADLGLVPVEGADVLSTLPDITYYRTDGKEIPADTIQTVVLGKV